MEALYIEGTKSTPKVEFDARNGKLSIAGQSYPENAFRFYEPIFAWLENYFNVTDTEVALEIYFYMPYINTSSSKCIMMLLDILENAYQRGKKVMVRWSYDEENEEALECAEEFKEDLEMPFEISLSGGL